MTQLETLMVPIDTVEIRRASKDWRPVSGVRNLSPIAIRKGKAGTYIVVDGHRRLSAAKLAGEKGVPITISRSKNPKLASLLANLHREDLNEMETAESVKELAAELKLTTNKAIGDEVGFSPSTPTPTS